MTRAPVTGGRSNAAVEAAHSPAFGDDGTLYAAYQHIATDYVTRTFAVSPTHNVTITNIPQPGQHDLAFLSHTVGRDVTFDDLRIAPSNPSPGQPVTLTAVLRSAGDLSVIVPVIVFHAGETPLMTTTLPITLSAGHTTTAQVHWTLPLSNTSYSFHAIADPGRNIVEIDEINNKITMDAPLPDLSIDRLYTTYGAGAFDVILRLTNEGGIDTARAFTIGLRAADPLTGVQIATINVGNGIGAKTLLTLTHTVTDPASLSGLGDTLWVVVDAGDTVHELDEGNNVAFAGLRIMPDLTLTADDIVGGTGVTITMHNAGFITVTDVLVAIYQDQIPGSLLYGQTIPVIPPNESAVVRTAQIVSGTLFVKADPNNVIAELNESNNLAVRVLASSPQQVPKQHIYLPLILKNAL
ncbi:MAG: hypothetical protein GY832_13750 [Chloroflexi bacterium]|nr:hypothetical protein [Chloroflexota bacterium]